MDLSIVINAGLSFVLFLVLQIIVFRRIAASSVFIAIVGVFAAAGAVTHSMLYFFLPPSSFDLALFTLFCSLVLYGLLSLIYILALFGIAATSLRIRLLGEIYTRGQQGMTEKELLVKYNRNVILAKRLERFRASGDVIFDGKQYTLGKRYSFYFFPASFFRLVWKLYKG